jgi:hypothetical protein
VQDHPPAGRLPGRSAMTILMRGVALEALAILCAVPIFAQSAIPNGHRIAGYCLAACLALLAAGVVVSVFGYRKAARETGMGYTTVPGYARSDPSLTLLSSRTFRVVSPPHTARPSRMPRD